MGGDIEVRRSVSDSCICAVIINEGCWGNSRVERIEYCEKHCPQCKHHREHPENEENASEELKEFHRRFYAHDPKRHADRADIAW